MRPTSPGRSLRWLGLCVLAALASAAWPARPAHAVLELDITRGHRRAAADRRQRVLRRHPGCPAARPRDRRRGQRRPRALGAVPADRPPRLHPVAGRAARRCRASPTGARSTPRRWSPAPSPAARRAASWRSSSGSGTCSPACRCAACALPPRPTTGGASAHQIADAVYKRITGEDALFRHPHRLRQRERSAHRAGQAARDHGPGRRQPPLPDRRRQPRADPALPPGCDADRLHGVSRPRAAGLSARRRDRRASRSSATSPA